MTRKRARRSKGGKKSIRKETFKPGKENPVDQLAMYQPGIIPQEMGKLTNRIVIGSQKCAQHSRIVKHVARLE